MPGVVICSYASLSPSSKSGWQVLREEHAQLKARQELSDRSIQQIWDQQDPFASRTRAKETSNPVSHPSTLNTLTAQSLYRLTPSSLNPKWPKALGIAGPPPRQSDRGRSMELVGLVVNQQQIF